MNINFQLQLPRQLYLSSLGIWNCAEENFFSTNIVYFFNGNVATIMVHCIIREEGNRGQLPLQRTTKAF